jgi:TonB family protein
MLWLMSNRFAAGLFLAIFLALSAVSSGADAADYSKEAVVVQNMATKVSFAADGAREWQETLSVRIQSEAAVRQFGVLAFPYRSENEQIKVEYVRVRKADGSVVETPESGILDVTTGVATAAPTYSDLRQKQIPVKALGAGDVLEYSIRSSQRRPEVPGQFWYDQYFIDDGVVLNQSLEVRVPKEKYVQVSSPKLKAETREDGDQRVYIWKHVHLEPSKPVDKKKTAAENEPPKVQLTSFKNWEEVGSWWAGLASPQAAVTPEIQDKAKELTTGLSSDSDKARAIYRYVGMKFRYISISFGAGRYRPHSAAEVFVNQYGDCKDKHTLFTALLKAAGIQAWPALIGAGVKFDPSVPSPAQFNHVITVLPQDGKYVWLDTTAEVAPFGLLNQVIRGEQALVIPAGGKPVLMKTPIDPPFTTSETVNVKSTLAADGTLSGHFDFQLVGDSALSIRSGFRQLAPAQWQTFAQQMSYSLGYAGDVSGVDVENLENLDKPFHYSYDYSRKNYSDWEEHKITPPVPPLGFGPGDEAEKPKEPFWAGAPGVLIYRASVQLPKGFSIELPEETTLTNDFADYSAHYSFKDGTLFAERKMVIKKAKVTEEQWAEYQKFTKSVRTDQTRFLSLSETSSVQTVTVYKTDPEVQQLMERVSTAMQARNANEARDLLAQVEQRSPKQAGLWAMYGILEMTSGNLEQAIADCRKEIQFHPDETPAYQQLSSILVHAGRRDEAIEAWRGALAVKPEDQVAAGQIASLMMQAKRYTDIPAVLEKPIAAAPDQYHLQSLRVEALLRSGQKEQGVGDAQKIAKATSQPNVLNDLAYSLADTGSAIGIAQEFAQKAVSQTELDCAKARLDSFENKDLVVVNSLAAEWDTLGWVYFKQDDLAKAEKYLDASWQLSQQAEVADHLGQLYDKQGRHAAAIHMWRLALASNSSYEDAQERLRNAGAPVSEHITTGSSGMKSAPVSAAEELGHLRTIKVPTLPKQTGSAEFFVVVSKQGIEDVQLIAGSEALKDSARAIQAAKYEFPFPDAGAEKIVRRGILSCSIYTTPSCQFTMLLPSTTTMAQMRGRGTQSVPDVIPATLRTKAEPEYSKAALQTKLEGTVLLSIVINEEGIPQDVSVLTSLGMGLDENAKECVLKWRFNPATKNGKPVSSTAKVEVNFRMLKASQQ